MLFELSCLMKRFFAYIVLLVLVLSCQKGGEDSTVPNGVLSLSINQPELLFSDSTYVTEADVLDDYYVTIVKLLDGQIIYSGKWSGMEQGMSLKSGIYTVTVESDMLDGASYDKPYCFGSKRITVGVGEIQNAVIQNQINSVGVSVEYSEAFCRMYDNFSISIYNEQESLQFGSAIDYGVGYFSSNESLTVDIVAESVGRDIVDSKSYTLHNSSSSDYHKLLFDVDSSSSIEPVMHHSVINSSLAKADDSESYDNYRLL